MNIWQPVIVISLSVCVTSGLDVTISTTLSTNAAISSTATTAVQLDNSTLINNSTTTEAKQIEVNFCNQATVDLWYNWLPPVGNATAPDQKMGMTACDVIRPPTVNDSLAIRRIEFKTYQFKFPTHRMERFSVTCSGSIWGYSCEGSDYEKW